MYTLAIVYHRQLTVVTVRNVVRSQTALMPLGGAIEVTATSPLRNKRNGCPDHLWNPHMVKADMIEEESTEDMVAYRAGMWRFHNVIASLKGEMKFSSPENA